MPVKPAPSPVDVPFGTLNTIPPDHAGPVGRLTSLKNCEVQHYTLPQPGQGLAKMLLQPRGGFTSMSRVAKSASDGTTVSSPLWNKPELLKATGDQLVTVRNAQPRVYNGTTWTDYGVTGTRITPNQLSESVLHTSDATITCPDSAKIGDVTCFVWNQLTVTGTSGTDQGVNYIGFRNSNGAWLVEPRALYTSTVGFAVAPLAKVVSDGTRFWVFHNSAANIEVKAYDTNGALLDSSFIARLISSSGHSTYWDITNYPGVVLVQGVSSAGDSGVQFSTWTFGAGLPHTTRADGTVHCDGPVAWSQNPLVNTFCYLETNVRSTTHLYGYEISAMTNVHEYAFGNIGVVPDTMTGWVDSDNNGVRMTVSYCGLASFTSPPTSGPPNDPALRVLISFRCDRLNATSLVSFRQSVLQVGRAFQINDDWYSLSYYQSGSGLTPFQSTVSLNMAAGTNTFTGAPVQSVPITVNDFYGGGTMSIPPLGPSAAPGHWFSQSYNTQAQGAIAHNAGDSVVNNTDGTATWVLNNSATFYDGHSGTVLFNPSQYSYLNISGSAIANNNTSFLITAVLSAHSVVTRSIGLNGQEVTNDTLAGVTATETANVVYLAESLNQPFPGNLSSLFNNAGALTVAGSGAAGNNGTFNIIEMAINPVVQAGVNPGPVQVQQLGYLFLTALTTQTFSGNFGGGMTMTVHSGPFYIWELFGSGIHMVTGDLLRVSGTGTAADGNDWNITAIDFIDLTFLFPETNVSGNPTVDNIPAMILPGSTKIDYVLADPTTAFTLTVTGAAFDNSYLFQFLTISNALNSVNNGTYKITQVLSPTKVQLLPVSGILTQVNEDMSSSVVVTVTFPLDTNLFQPTWMISSLSNSAQEIVGAFESSLAYADWRYDGATVPNHYPLALASMTTDQDGTLRFVLPFRTQSWTTNDGVSNQIATGDAVLRSSVGIKQFSLSPVPGQAIVDTGEMLLPGPMAVQFSASGFHDAGIVIGPERPYLISTGTGGQLTDAGAYQYVFVIEISNDNGDQIQSIVSPALNVNLGPGQNKATIGGRFPCPTLWPAANIRMTGYRTAYQNGAPTTQHFRITNPLDPNGAGFTLSSFVSGPRPDTWQFVDTIPDYQILSAPTLYTDALEVPRQPAPPFQQGAVEWNQRTWLTGYDGANWMSSQPTEGLQTYYSRLWRIPYPPEDKLVAQAPLESILLQLCQRSIWYLPQTNSLPQAVPDATETLPTPIPTPFTNGCTGFAVTLRSGVAYSSTAGGVWLITRNLENVWLSQPVNGLLGTVTGMCLDDRQRLWVTDGVNIFVYDQLPQAWFQFAPPSTPSLVASYAGQVVYQDSNGVNLYDPAALNDNLAGVITGIAPDFTVAGINLSSVRQYMRCWAIQLLGQYVAPHRLNVTVTYPDETDFAPTVFDPYTPTAGKPYLMQFNPLNEEASTFQVRVLVDFTGVGTPGASARFEMLSMEVGVMDGQTRVVKGSQIATGR